MNVITINGTTGAGKTDALQVLAKVYQTQVMSVQDFESLLPALNRNLVGLAPSTFIDDVPKKLLPKILKAVKHYPDDYFIYIAVAA